jgi:hypothetical protein
VLTVTSGGSIVAEINMSGHYTTANFHLVSGSGGTAEIYDPPAGAQQSGSSGSPQISLDTLLGSQDNPFLHGRADPASNAAWSLDPKGGLPSLTANLASELTNIGGPNVRPWADGVGGVDSSEWSYAPNHVGSIGGPSHDNNQHTNGLVAPKQ